MEYTAAPTRRVAMSRCPECQMENLDIFKFCCQCGSNLQKACPHCGFINPVEFIYCKNCGQALVRAPEPEPAPQLESEIDDTLFVQKLAQTQRRLPDGLTEKVLARKDVIEGKRRQIAVMFCEMEGFEPIYRRLGRDRVYPVIDTVFETLIKNVHTYGGTVNKISAGGIMALFGTPIEVDDAPQRAVRCALAIHRDIDKLNAHIKSQYPIRPLRICTGINTGPVVVRNIHEDLTVDLTPVGDTITLASGVEKIAEPGSIYVTEETFKLTERLFDYDALGEITANGTGTLVKVFKVVAPGSRKRHTGLNGSQGLKPFIGREKELEISMDIKDYKEACKTESLKDIDRYPKRFRGMKLKYRGEIMRLTEHSGETEMVLDVSSDPDCTEDSVFIWYGGPTGALEGDIVEVWGEVRGSYAYASVGGWKITLPLIKAAFIEVMQPANPEVALN